MNKTLIFTVSAVRSFEKLPLHVQEELYRALLLYGLTGRGNVKRMKGQPGVRLRVGEYRVVFEETAYGLTILAAGDRKDVYR